MFARARVFLCCVWQRKKCKSLFRSGGGNPAIRVIQLCIQTPPPPPHSPQWVDPLAIHTWSSVYAHGASRHTSFTTVPPHEQPMASTLRVTTAKKHRTYNGCALLRSKKLLPLPPPVLVTHGEAAKTSRQGFGVA
eukprot:SAG22_NODE_1079_length_5672_cov_4.668222_3_plen_135_part_00